MSLEEALRENTEALKANTAALLKTGGGKASAADAAIEKEATRAAAAKPAAAGKKPAAAKKTTLDTIKERFGGYLGIEDKAERKNRIAQVQQIVDHFGVAKASELDEANWDEALAFLKQFEDGEEPDFGDEGGGDDESLI